MSDWRSSGGASSGRLLGTSGTAWLMGFSHARGRARRYCRAGSSSTAGTSAGTRSRGTSTWASRARDRRRYGHHGGHAAGGGGSGSSSSSRSGE